MKIEYKKPNDDTVYTDEYVLNMYVGIGRDGYFLNYTIDNDSRESIIVCPIKLNSIKLSV